MPVAVLSALQTELDLLLEALDSADRSHVADWPVWTGQWRGTALVLAKAGLGKVNTAALTALLWARHRPSLFVFTGVAGSLDPLLGVGDVVIGERTLQHDSGVIGQGGRLDRYQPGHVPFFNPTDEFGFAPSPDLLETMRTAVAGFELTPVLDRTPTVTFGTIATGDQFVQDGATRDRLHKELGAHAVEMEGAALAQVASRLGVDHVVLRALSDLAQGEAIVQFDRFVPEVSANSARLVMAFVARLEEHDRDLSVGS